MFYRDHPKVDCMCQYLWFKGWLWCGCSLSFHRVCWPLSSWERVWFVLEIKPSQGVRQDFLSTPWLSPPCQRKIWSPLARAVALRSRLAQVLSHLSVCVSLSSHWGLCRGVLKEVRLTCLQTSVSVGIWAPLRCRATLCPFPVVCHPRFSPWAGVECLPGLSEDSDLLVTGA